MQIKTMDGWLVVGIGEPGHYGSRLILDDPDLAPLTIKDLVSNLRSKILILSPGMYRVRVRVPDVGAVFPADDSFEFGKGKVDVDEELWELEQTRTPKLVALIQETALQIWKGA